MLCIKNIDNRVIRFQYFIFLLLVLSSEAKTMSKRGIMDNINNGIKYAGQLLGIKTSLDVADLVTKAFASNFNTKRQDNMIKDHSDNLKSPTTNAVNPTGVFTGLLRLLGFDNSKLGALAINGIIMIAQMIGNILISRPPSNQQKEDTHNEYSDQHQPRMEQKSGRQVREGLPIDWILANPSQEFSKLLVEIRDRRLPEYLAENVGSVEKQKGEGDCIKLLLCKSAPFVWGMQKSVANTIDGSNSSEEEEVTNQDGDRLHAFFKYLPDVEEYKSHGHLCEKRYPDCNISTI